MLNVTQSALDHLSGLLDEAAAEEEGLRIAASSEGLGLFRDATRPGDETIEHGGKTLLLLDGEVAQLLDERTLDVEQTDEGTVLTLR